MPYDYTKKSSLAFWATSHLPEGSRITRSEQRHRVYRVFAKIRNFYHLFSVLSLAYIFTIHVEIHTVTNFEGLNQTLQMDIMPAIS